MKFWKGFTSGFILAWIVVWIYDWLAWRRRISVGTPYSDVDVRTKRRVIKPQEKSDDLEAINGIGPTYARRLRKAGVRTFVRLASMQPEQVLEITQSGRGFGEIQNWIAQAKRLS